MYDIVFDFISNNLINSTLDTYNLASILSITTIVLFYIALVKLVIWIFDFAKNIVGF